MTIVPKLRIKLTHLDATLAPNAGPELDDTSLPRVPIIRIFGHIDTSGFDSTGETGTQTQAQQVNACVHVHQVFPYVYIEYAGSKKPEAVQAHIRLLRTALNRALSSRRSSSSSSSSRPPNPNPNPNPHTPAPDRFIRHILLTSALPFYGFSPTHTSYLKLLLSDPTLLQPLAAVLRSGAILGRKWEVYEAQVGYVLQFLVDFNLFGCGWLEVRDGLVRRGAGEGDEDDPSQPSQPPNSLQSLLSSLPSSPVSRTARSPSTIELDIPSYAILNRHLVLPRVHGRWGGVGSPIPRPIPRPSAPSNSNESSGSASGGGEGVGSQTTKLVHSIRELWTHERARRTAAGMDPEPAMPREAVSGEFSSQVREKDVDSSPSDSGNAKSQEAGGGKGNGKTQEEGKKQSQEKTGDVGRWWEASERDWIALEARIARERESILSKAKLASNSNLDSNPDSNASGDAKPAEDEEDEEDTFHRLAWTAFESTEMLWDPKWRVIRREPVEPQQDSGQIVEASSQQANVVSASSSSSSSFLPSTPTTAIPVATPHVSMPYASPSLPASASTSTSSTTPRPSQQTRSQNPYEARPEDEPPLPTASSSSTDPSSSSPTSSPSKSSKPRTKSTRPLSATIPSPRSSPSKKKAKSTDVDDEGVNFTILGSQAVRSAIEQETMFGERDFVPALASNTGVGVGAGAGMRTSPNKTPNGRKKAGVGAFSPVKGGGSPLATPRGQRTSPLKNDGRPLSALPLPPLKAPDFTGFSSTSTKQADTMDEDVTPKARTIDLPSEISLEKSPRKRFLDDDDEHSRNRESKRRRASPSDVPPLSTPPPHILASSSSSFPISPSLPIIPSSSFPVPSSSPATYTYTYALPPPTRSSLLSTLRPQVIYQDPFYSNPADRPNKAVETAAGYSVFLGGPPLDPSSGSASGEKGGMAEVRGMLEWGIDIPRQLSGGENCGGYWESDRPTLQRSPRKPARSATNANKSGWSETEMAFLFGGKKVYGKVPYGFVTPDGGIAGSGDGVDAREHAGGVTAWAYAAEPPGPRDVRRWLDQNPTNGVVDGTSDSKVARTGNGVGRIPQRKAAFRSQIIGPTQLTQYVVKPKPRRAGVNASQMQYMSILALEIFAACSEDRTPDPEKDPLTAVFWCYQSYLSPPVDEAERRASYTTGIIALDDGTRATSLNKDGKYPGIIDDEEGRGVVFVEDELSMFNALENLVLDLDPDVLTSFELAHGGWGYVGARYRFMFGGDPSYGTLVSRIVEGSARSIGWAGWGSGQDPSFLCTGRHVLNLWSIFRKEYTHTSYTFENNVWQILKKRVPRYSNVTLTKWIKSSTPADVFRVLHHMHERAILVMELVNESDLVTRNSEFARVFGVDFMSVLTRGSQFKVEAFMFRLAKPESFMLISPSREDVGLQNAAECIPMIMEPRSGFYKSPLLVLDFQSLYPSIMIAYNYCYSTCLGRINTYPRVDGTYKLGWTDLDLPEGLLEQLKEQIHVAPNGIMYAKRSVRKSLLATMLEELLETRVMVKQAMKTAKSDKAVLKMLDARQLSLKFIANVTYGYTSASFSGRMPCVEIADSIVEAGRQTLEKAIRLIDDTPEWGGKVVYGDTDSLFISLPGKSKAEAFRIGQEMADRVTLMNPKPIKLKFEKVYFPCVLESKKRYVGFKYENPDDTVPVFDAKGIETVRRDGVRAQSKMLEVCLKILFRTQDLSQVKDYCIREWSKILGGKVTVEDFVLSKEVRLGTYSDKGNPQAHAVVGALLESEDKGSYLFGDRVPHVIARRGPQGKLAETAYHVKEFLWEEGSGKRPLHLDEQYYIEQLIIPPLARVFEHIGADVRQWFKGMPKIRRADGLADYDSFDPPQVDTSVRTAPAPMVLGAAGKSKFVIDSHFRKTGCASCGKATDDAPLCPSCLASLPTTLASMLSRLRDAESKARDTHLVCASCSNSEPHSEIKCESYDCTWLFERRKAGNDLARIQGLWGVVKDHSW